MSEYNYKGTAFSKSKPSKPMGFLQRKLVELRRKNHVYNTQLAEEIGCTRSCYQRLETGNYCFTDNHLYALANYYGIEFQKQKDLQIMDEIVKVLRRNHNKLDAISLLQQLIDELEHTIIQVHK